MAEIKITITPMEGNKIKSSFTADKDLSVFDIIGVMGAIAESLDKQTDTYFNSKYKNDFPRPEVMDVERKSLTIGEMGKGAGT